MDINQLAVLFCQIVCFFNSLYTVFSGQFKMRRTAGNINTHFQCPDITVVISGSSVYSVLRECNHLNVNKILDLFLQFQQAFHSQKARVCRVNVSSYSQNTVGNIPVNNLSGIFFYLLLRQTFSPVIPDANRLD